LLTDVGKLPAHRLERPSLSLTLTHNFIAKKYAIGLIFSDFGANFSDVEVIFSDVEENNSEIEEIFSDFRARSFDIGVIFSDFGAQNLEIGANNSEIEEIWSEIGENKSEFDIPKQPVTNDRLSLITSPPSHPQLPVGIP
jgi:hypothetical protein